MNQSEPRPLIVFAPGSMAGVSAALIDGFVAAFPDAARPEFTFAMTGALAERLIAGEPADVGLFANRSYADDVHRAGFLSAPQSLAGNRLSIVRAKTSSRTIATQRDLAAPGVRLALLPADRDPCGAYAAALFEREGLADAIVAKLASGDAIELGPRHPVMPSLAGGAIDALVVYSTFAAGFGDFGVEIPLPPELDMHDEIEFTIGLVELGAGHPLAAAFVDWMLGPAGQGHLRRAGFLPPKGNQ